MSTPLEILSFVLRSDTSLFRAAPLLMTVAPYPPTPMPLGPPQKCPDLLDNLQESPHDSDGKEDGKVKPPMVQARYVLSLASRAHESRPSEEALTPLRSHLVPTSATCSAPQIASVQSRVGLCITCMPSMSFTIPQRILSMSWSPCGPQRTFQSSPAKLPQRRDVHPA